jgi:hypothetical protein
LPLSSHALHYYRSGRPFLQRYLPFWLAVIGEQLIVLAIPVPASSILWRTGCRRSMAGESGSLDSGRDPQRLH